MHDLAGQAPRGCQCEECERTRCPDCSTEARQQRVLNEASLAEKDDPLCYCPAGRQAIWRYGWKAKQDAAAAGGREAE